MLTGFATNGLFTVRQLIGLLADFDQPEGVVGMVVFDRSGRITIRAARNVALRPSDLGGSVVGEPPVILIVAGDPSSPVAL